MGTIDISALSKLSKLVVTDKKQQESIESAIKETLSYVDNLNELDVSQLEPTYSPIGKTNVGFDDAKDPSRCLPPQTFEVDKILS